jgi:hypothetical protein
MQVPPTRRMTLRQLLTHTEKCSRDLIEQFHSSLINAVGDFRDLTRPVRRKSHYPTLLALVNSMNNLLKVGKDTAEMAEYMLERLTDIHEHARREKANRM